MENKGASLVAHMVKNLGWEDPLEEGMATLLYSCLENPSDGGAWRAAVYGVAQSRTRLKRLSSSSSSIDILGLLRWLSV